MSIVWPMSCSLGVRWWFIIWVAVCIKMVIINRQSNILRWSWSCCKGGMMKNVRYVVYNAWFSWPYRVMMKNPNKISAKMHMKNYCSSVIRWANNFYKNTCFHFFYHFLILWNQQSQKSIIKVMNIIG